MISFELNFIDFVFGNKNNNIWWLDLNIPGMCLVPSLGNPFLFRCALLWLINQVLRLSMHRGLHFEPAIVNWNLISFSSNIVKRMKYSLHICRCCNLNHMILKNYMFINRTRLLFFSPFHKTIFHNNINIE